jgi:hypothetical protein
VPETVNVLVVTTSGRGMTNQMRLIVKIKSDKRADARCCDPLNQRIKWQTELLVPRASALALLRSHSKACSAGSEMP